jgi:hypothetical protein
MKSLSTLALFLCCTSVVFSQNMFQKRFAYSGNNIGKVVRQTPDGGFIIAGYSTLYGGGNPDIYLIKTTAKGALSWTKRIGNATYEVGLALDVTSDGGFISAGIINTGIATWAAFDIILTKTDSLGNISWSRKIQGTLADYGYSVHQTTDGGYIITGVTSANDDNIICIKTNALGLKQWSTTIGGPGVDLANDIKQTKDGGYILTGYTNSFILNNTDLYLVKLNSAGKVKWARTYGNAHPEVGFSVEQTNDGGYIVAGYSWKGIQDNDILLLKTDTLGNVQWTRAYGGNANDIGNCVQQTNDGGYIVAGYTFSFSPNRDAYVIKTNPVGLVLWTNIYGGSNAEQANYIQQTVDGYIFTGFYLGEFNYDCYLVKTDAAGNSGCSQSAVVTPVWTPVFTAQSQTPVITTASLSMPFALSSGTGGIAITQCSTNNLRAAVSSINTLPKSANTVTIIFATESKNGHMLLRIFDADEILVSTLLDEDINPGEHKIDFIIPEKYMKYKDIYIAKLEYSGVNSQVEFKTPGY